MMPLWRYAELIGTVLGIVVATLILLAFGGCAAMQKERQLLYAPEPLPSAKTIFTRNYTESLKAVDKGTATPVEIVAYVDATNALQAKSCHEWLNRVTLARRGIVASDHNMAVIGGLLTTLAGAFAWPADAVTVLGAGQVAMQGLGQNIRQDVLGAPSEYQAQSTLLGLLSACHDRLLTDAPTLKFSQVYERAEGCMRLCSFDAAAQAADRALSTATIIVQPTGGITAVKP